MLAARQHARPRRSRAAAILVVHSDTKDCRAWVRPRAGAVARCGSSRGCGGLGRGAEGPDGDVGARLGVADGVAGGHAELFGDALGAGVGGVDQGDQLGEADAVEGVVAAGERRLGGEAAAPGGAGEAVAELGAVGDCGDEGRVGDAAEADQPPARAPLGRLEREEAEAVLLRDGGGSWRSIRRSTRGPALARNSWTSGSALIAVSGSRSASRQGRRRRRLVRSSSPLTARGGRGRV